MNAHPFRFRLDTPLGPLRVDVLPGRTAEVRPEVSPGPRPGFPLQLDGVRFAFRARFAQGRRGWQARDIEVLPEIPGNRPGAEQVVLALMPSLAPALEREIRRFVERDLVEVLVERRGEGAEMERVRAEIARRRDKLRRLALAAGRAEVARSGREAALRAELASLCADPPVANAPA